MSIWMMIFRNRGMKISKYRVRLKKAQIHMNICLVEMIWSIIWVIIRTEIKYLLMIRFRMKYMVDQWIHQISTNNWSCLCISLHYFCWRLVIRFVTMWYGQFRKLYGVGVVWLVCIVGIMWLICLSVRVCKWVLFWEMDLFIPS